jgi:pilus assembly protein CpaE
MPQSVSSLDSGALVAGMKAPVIGILGGKGGAGATTMAVNLAAALAMANVKTTVIDADLQQPNAAIQLGVQPVHSLVELLERTSDLDRQVYDACCIELLDKNGLLRLISPALSGDAAVLTNLSQVAESLQVMRSYADAWIVDLPRHLDKHLVTLTDTCDCIVLVLEATVFGVAAAQRWLNVFKELGYSEDRVTCVVNRSGSRFRGVEDHLKDCFAERAIFHLPNASQALWDASTSGIPLVVSQPNHPYSRAAATLSHQLLDSFRRGQHRA